MEIPTFVDLYRQGRVPLVEICRAPDRAQAWCVSVTPIASSLAGSAILTDTHQRVETWTSIDAAFAWLRKVGYEGVACIRSKSPGYAHHVDPRHWPLLTAHGQVELPRATSAALIEFTKAAEAAGAGLAYTHAMVGVLRGFRADARKALENVLLLQLPTRATASQTDNIDDVMYWERARTGYCIRVNAGGLRQPPVRGLACPPETSDDLPVLPAVPASNYADTQAFERLLWIRKAALSALTDIHLPVEVRTWYLLFGECEPNYWWARAELERDPDLHARIVGALPTIRTLELTTYVRHWLYAMHVYQVHLRPLLVELTRVFGVEPLACPWMQQTGLYGEPSHPRFIARGSATAIATVEPKVSQASSQPPASVSP